MMDDVLTATIRDALRERRGKLETQRLRAISRREDLDRTIATVSDDIAAIDRQLDELNA